MLWPALTLGDADVASNSSSEEAVLPQIRILVTVMCPKDLKGNKSIRNSSDYVCVSVIQDI